MEVSTRSIGFTEAEREAFDRRQCRAQADFERMLAAGTPEGQERIAERMWERDVEQPRMQRRIAQARERKQLVAVVAPRSTARAREHRSTAARRASSSSTTSSADPGSSDPDPATRTAALPLGSAA